jgi:hypothetical protein
MSDDATEQIPELTPDEIRRRLTLVNPELVKEVYALTKGQIDHEAARYARLDLKANTVITAAGLSMAVASSLGGIVGSGKRLPSYLLWMFGVTAIVGLAAVGFAILAVLVSKAFARVSDGAMFNADVLERADAPSGADDLSTTEKRDFGAAQYRQYMAAHMWDMYLKDRAQLDRKAGRVQTGQCLFGVFLVLLVACEATLIGAIMPSDVGQTAAASTAGALRQSDSKEVKAMPEKPPPPAPPPPRDFKTFDPSPTPTDVPAPKPTNK